MAYFCLLSFLRNRCLFELQSQNLLHSLFYFSIFFLLTFSLVCLVKGDEMILVELIFCLYFILFVVVLCVIEVNEWFGNETECVC